MTPEESAPVALARRLLGAVLRVRPGESVTVESWNHTMSYATACVAEARQRGARPLLLLEDEGAFWRSLDGSVPAARVGAVGAHELAALARTSAYVYFPGPADRPRYRSVPTATRTALDRTNDAWLAVARRARVRTARCVLGDASEPQAAFWGVSATTWRGQLLKGALESDLAQIARDGRRAEQLLRRGHRIRVTAANGTDLALQLKGRRPWVDDGVVGPEDLARGHGLTVSPPGSVLVAIDESSAEGIVIGNRASYLPSGRADGGQWEFHRGRLLNAWFTEGHQTFEEAYTAAPRGRDIAGLLSVGLNPALPPGTPQVEDQEAGAVTIGVGGNRTYGGTVNCPYLAWIVVGEATVAVDGRPLLDRGKLLGS
jgi:leucyl aminopeptidase (aminopeptidase T)